MRKVVIVRWLLSLGVVVWIFIETGFYSVTLFSLLMLINTELIVHAGSVSKETEDEMNELMDHMGIPRNPDQAINGS